MFRNFPLLLLIVQLPVLAICFLLFFGKNEFEVPVYHQEAPTTIPTACDMDYHFPYKVPANSRLNLQGVTLITFMDKLDSTQRNTLKFYLSRWLDEGDYDDAVQWVSVYPSSDRVSYKNSSRVVALDSLSYREEKSCYYLAGMSDVVLVDSLGSIRGYYRGTSLDEMDRLKIELDILLH